MSKRSRVEAVLHPIMLLAEAVLAAHLAIILFNLFGLIVVPLGAARGWRFVHVAWWRVLHLALLAAVAAQALAGRACVLTVWESKLAVGAASPAPLIMGWVDRLIYWRLPIWVFAALYALVFGYALALLWLAPLRRTG
ncbi:MAG TPA: DUF2784 family protein [Stellaceae bacterium]|jgi:hypothetical protein|nr:DUF2784 family protein [Stellaceae bacterium]